MRFRKLAIGALVFLPLTAFAQQKQEPATKSDELTRPEGDPARARAMMGMGWRRRGMAAEQDMDQAAQFMRENSPNRWQVVDSLPEDSPDRRAVMAFITLRWRSLQNVKDEDAPLYEIKLKQLHIEDGIYGMLATTQSAAEREPLRSRLRESVDELLNLGFAEREHRIEQLRKMVKTEQEKLDTSRKQVGTMVDRRTNALVAEGPSALRAGMPQWPLRNGGRALPQPTTKPIPTTE